MQIFEASLDGPVLQSQITGVWSKWFRVTLMFRHLICLSDGFSSNSSRRQDKGKKMKILRDNENFMGIIFSGFW
jgi:hypothetical protein